jgi:hypothetical protein
VSLVSTMSIRLMAEAWERAPVDGGALLVLLALCDYANDTGTAWPAVGSLARRARLSTRQARTILRRLELAGLVTPVGAYRHPGQRGSSIVRYRVSIPTTGKPEVSADLPLKPEVCDIKAGSLRHESRKPTSDDPSGTTIEPPVNSPPRAAAQVSLSQELKALGVKGAETEWKARALAAGARAGEGRDILRWMITTRRQDGKRVVWPSDCDPMIPEAMKTLQAWRQPPKESTDDRT